MDPNLPRVVIEGLEILIERDLEKHKSLLERTQTELRSYREAKSHEIRRKRHYKSLVGGGKFNDNSLRSAIKGEINTNIKHYDNKCVLAERKVEEHQRIIDHLTEQLEKHKEDMQALAEYKRKMDGSSN